MRSVDTKQHPYGAADLDLFYQQALLRIGGPAGRGPSLSVHERFSETLERQLLTLGAPRIQ